MSNGSPVRRSFRLKDKPDPEYVYKNFLRKDYLPPAVVQVNKKYDDLFSSVVTNAFLLDIQKTPDQYYAEKEAAAALKRAATSSESSDSDVVILDDDSDGVTPSEDVVIVPKRIKIKTPPRKVQKMMEKIERNRQKSTQKTVKQLERIVAKIESGVRRIEENSARRVKLRTSSSTSSTSSDLEILETVVSGEKTFTCTCGKSYENHDECHRHVLEEHSNNEECTHCGHTRDRIRATNGCHICSEFAADLEQHLSRHYRNCTGRNAVMECRFCSRQFITVKEVIVHEKEKHTERQIRRQTQIFKCQECPFESQSQELLLAHYSDFHVDLNALGERINELQIKVNAEKEECPFCRINVASRKCFRAHLLRSHWQACKTLSRMTLDANLIDDEHSASSDLEIKREIEELLEANAAQNAPPPPREKMERKGAEPEMMMLAVKTEIKEEMIHEEDDKAYGRAPTTSSSSTTGF